MKIACIQSKILNTREKCYQEIENILKNLLAEHSDCDIVCLPERWVPLNGDMNSNLQKERGDDYTFAKRLAERYSINVISGAIWEKRDHLEKPIITCYYYNERGEEIGRQNKIHLYTYERKFFTSGKEIKIFKLGAYNFAILICFDMAFYETPRLAAENGADLLFSPTQIRREGIENWKIYLRARALENRIPVAACNTLGEIGEKTFPGNSQLISFLKGPLTPSKLKIIEGPFNSRAFVCDSFDLEFPRKLRKHRLNEKVDQDQIKVKKVPE
ncbi:MAG: carbon-nitrogen hydrolase family protein [Promethearchaeia archaeon]